MNLEIKESNLPCDNYTEEQFYQHLRDFRQLMGSRKFWEQSDDVKDNAVKGLSYVYMHTISDNDSVVTSFKSSVAEFDLRSRFTRFIKNGRKE